MASAPRSIHLIYLFISYQSQHFEEFKNSSTHSSAGMACFCTSMGLNNENSRGGGQIHWRCVFRDHIDRDAYKFRESKGLFCRRVVCVYAPLAEPHFSTSKKGSVEDPAASDIQKWDPVDEGDQELKDSIDRKLQHDLRQRSFDKGTHTVDTVPYLTMPLLVRSECLGIRGAQERQREIRNDPFTWPSRFRHESADILPWDWRRLGIRMLHFIYFRSPQDGPKVEVVEIPGAPA